MVSCAGALRPGGAIVANCWNGPPGSEGRAKLAAFPRAERVETVSDGDGIETVRDGDGETDGDGERYGSKRHLETYLVVVDGQESNVVVVAELADPTRGADGEPFDACKVGASRAIDGGVGVDAGEGARGAVRDGSVARGTDAERRGGSAQTERGRDRPSAEARRAVV